MLRIFINLILFDVMEFDSEEAANDELHKRVTELFKMMK